MFNVKRYLIIALIVGLIARSIIFFNIYPNIQLISCNDQSIYISLSNFLLSNLSFDTAFGSERVPLYPTFLTLIHLLSDSLFFVLIIQNLLGLSVIFIAYLIGKEFSAKIGIISAILTGLNLNMSLYSNQILTEALFYPLFFFFIYIFIKSTKSTSKKYLTAMAVLLGVCTLIRPVTMYLPIFMVAYFIFWGNIGGKLDRIKYSCVFLIVFCLTISPWLYRNYNIYGHPKLETQGGIGLIGWYIPEIARYEEKIDLSTAVNKYNNIWKEQAATLPANVKEDPFLLDKEARRFAFDYIRNASLTSIVKAWAGGVVKNLAAPVSVELAYILQMDWSHFYEAKGSSIIEQAINFIFYNKNKLYSFLLISGILLTLLFRISQIVGAVIIFKKNKRILFVCIMIITYFLMVNGPIGYAKYRLPFEAILVLLSAIFIDWIWKNNGQDR